MAASIQLSYKILFSSVGDKLVSVYNYCIDLITETIIYNYVIYVTLCNDECYYIIMLQLSCSLKD